MASMIERASLHDYAPACSLRTASAEDVIVLKAFADRPQDWLDIEGMIARQKGKLDWHQIEQELRPLSELKEAPEILDRLQELRQKLGRK